MCEAEEELFNLLKEAGCDEDVIAHSRVVREVALLLANKIKNNGHQIDIDLVLEGSILHDVGRSKTHGMDHADVSGRICRARGFKEGVCRVVERHIGAGLYANERTSFGLSAEDRVPQSIEEKVVTHADNLVKGSRMMQRDEFLRSFSKHPAEIQKRYRKLADEIEKLAGMAGEDNLMN